MADDKPAWRYWLNLAEVPLEDAICLSLDFAPGILDDFEQKLVRSNRVPILRTFRANYVARLDAARTHIKVGSLTARYNQFKRVHLVKLADLRKWGECLPVPLDFPEEFPRLPPLPETTASELLPKNEPSLRNENANLRIIAAMLALLRDDEGGRFPSDAKIIEVLVDKYGAADGVSKSNLEKVFPAAKKAAGDDLTPKNKHPK